METLLYINDFATRSFRDVADQDYIAARMSYKAQLREPFLWSSLQAIEKYLKAILLFNGKSAKGLGHKLIKSINRVEGITDIGFNLPDDVQKFIAYLDEYGANRYLEHSTYLRQHALLELDRTVWHIRRYCFYMRGEREKSDGSIIEWLPLNVERIHSDLYKNNPQKYNISNGFLENAIKNRTEASKHLIWHNFYYGRNNRKTIKNYKWHISSTNPTITMHPDAFEELDKVVQFSKEVRDYYGNRRS